VTLLVGIKCSDGVVVASDSAATYNQGLQYTIGQQEVQKVHKIGDAILYASTGAIGPSQLIREALGKMASVKGHTKPQSSAEVMAFVGDIISQQVKKVVESAAALVPLVGQQRAGITVLCQSLVALACHGEARLYQFDYSGAPEEATKDLPFIALGGGQALADPFLALLKRALWSSTSPTVAEGRFAAAWTIVHVARTNFGGVGLPLQIATLSLPNGKPQVEFATPAEHYEAVEAAEAALRDHVRRAAGGAVGAGDPPQIPKPS